MTSTNQCVVCGRPTPDGYACAPDALSLSETLRTAAGHAEDAQAVIARQARYGGGGRGGSDEPLPVDLTAAARLGAINTSVRFWTEDLRNGEPLPTWHRTAGPQCGMGVRCPHASCAGLRVIYPPSVLAQELAWLSGQVEALRKHPAAAEAFPDLETVCADLARLVDRPADRDLVGMCDCGKVLYAPRGKTVVTCPVPTCRLHWNVEQSRNILRRALDGKLVTAGEAARLGAYLDTDRNQEQIRKLVNAWSSRGSLTPHGTVGDEPAFRFGDISDRLARTPRRTTRADAA